MQYKTSIFMALLILVTSPLLTSALPFGPPISYSTGDGPRSVVACDLNGDGYSDIAVAGEGANWVWIKYNNGNGTFGREDGWAVGIDPVSLCAADFDGDGDIDLATANFYSSGVSILKNEGDYSFAAAANYPACNGPYAIVAADFNGDGAQDLAVTNGYVTGSTDHMAILINNGDGSFAGPATYNYGNNLVSVDAADLDGDGDQDLVMANYLDNVIYVMKNNGSGTFGAPVSYATGYSPWERPSSVFAADLDGDGDKDLAVANSATDNVGVLKNTGVGTFAASTNYPAGEAPVSIFAADLDNDGDLDLVTANEDSDSISVLLNFGDGTYSAAYNYPALNGPFSVVAEDFNNDGDIDLAVANYYDDKACFLHNSHFNDPPILNYIGPQVTSEGEPLTFGVSATDYNGAIPLFTTTTLPEGADFTDHGNGTGTFEWTPDLGQADIYTITFYAIDDLGAVGWEIVVITANDDFVLFELPVDYEAGRAPKSITAADLDGDGDQDLITGVEIAMDLLIMNNNGNATFGDPYFLLESDVLHPVSVFAEDLDGDGDQDLAVANEGLDNIAILKNKGDGTFDPPVFYDAADGPRSIFAADLDGDGDQDLAVANCAPGNVSVFKNDGNGIYAAPVNYATGECPLSVFAADLDGDGNQDLAVANSNSDNVSVLKNIGDGIFSTAVNYAAGRLPRSVFAADLDDDGDHDLAVAAWFSDDVSILKNNGLGTFAAAISYPAEGIPWSVFAADLDDDGDPDLAVATGVSPDGICILKNSGDGFFGAPICYDAGNHGPVSVVASDLDNDGDQDLAVAKSNSNENSYVSVLINRTKIIADIDDETSNELIPSQFTLSQNFPNPFNPVTAIKYSISRRSRVTISIHDILGRKVATIVDKEKPAGTYTVVWDGTDDKGRHMATGLYIYQLVTEEFSESRKMLLLK
jgi:hypothetical protein